MHAARALASCRRDAVAADRDAYVPILGLSVNDPAMDQEDAGRHSEALAAAQEAVSVYRQLADNDPGAYLPALAMSVNNLAVDLGDAGRRPEALAAA